MKKTTRAVEIFYALTVIEPDLSCLDSSGLMLDDWEEAARIALKCRLPLIFYSNIKKQRLEDKFSAGLLDPLRQGWLAAVKDAVILKEHFFEIARLFSTENIKMVPIKGASFLTDFYSEEGLRAASDLDCFIQGSDFEKSRGILKKLGYEPKFSIRRGVMVNYGQECEFICPYKPRVDLHYRLFSWHEEKYLFHIDSRAFFERAVLTRRAALDFWCLNKEDELFYCLFLMVKEGQGFSRYFLDTDSLVRVHGNTLDWDRFRAQIEKNPLKSELIGWMNFLSRSLKTPFPNFITQFASEAGRKSDFLIFKEKNKNKSQLFGLTKSWADKLQLLIIYAKWQFFKAFGFFSEFFMTRNNPCKLTSTLFDVKLPS